MICTNTLKTTCFLLFLLWFPAQVSGSNEAHDHCLRLIRAGEQELETGFYSKSMERFKTAKTLAEKNQWHDLNFSATIDIGAAFYRILDYGESLKNNIEAYKIALDHRLGPERETRALNNIAGVYFKDANYEKAKEFILKAYHNALKTKDSVSIGRYASNLALIANKQHDLKTSAHYTEIAFKVLKNFPGYRIMPQKVALEQLFLAGRFGEAKQMARALLANDSVNPGDKASTLLFLSKIYDRENHPARAVYYARQARQLAGWETKTEIYRLLSDIYQKNNNLRAALLYKDSLVLATDSVSRATNQQILENNRIKFEIFNYQKTISENREEIRHQKRIFWYLTMITLLGAVLTFLIVRYRSIQNKQKKRLYEQDKTIIRLELEKKEKDKLLLEKQINEMEMLARLEKEKTDKKSRELVAKALFLANQNQLIEKVITSLSSVEKKEDPAGLNRQVVYLKQMLRDSSKHENYLVHFEEVNRDFINHLNREHPDLSSNDIRFLSYIYMNLNTKEIASLLNITIDSCKRKKIRISQKLGLESSTLLYDYISNTYFR